MISACYTCNFDTDNELEYQRHGALKHPKNPLLYPSLAEIKQYGLKAQGKHWEMSNKIGETADTIRKRYLDLLINLGMIEKTVIRKYTH